MLDDRATDAAVVYLEDFQAAQRRELQTRRRRPASTAEPAGGGLPARPPGSQEPPPARLASLWPTLAERAAPTGQPAWPVPRPQQQTEALRAQPEVPVQAPQLPPQHTSEASPAPGLGSAGAAGPGASPPLGAAGRAGHNSLLSVCPPASAPSAGGAAAQNVVPKFVWLGDTYTLICRAEMSMTWDRQDSWKLMDRPNALARARGLYAALTERATYFRTEAPLKPKWERELKLCVDHLHIAMKSASEQQLAEHASASGGGAFAGPAGGVDASGTGALAGARETAPEAPGGSSGARGAGYAPSPLSDGGTVAAGPGAGASASGLAPGATGGGVVVPPVRASAAGGASAAAGGGAWPLRRARTTRRRATTVALGVGSFIDMSSMQFTLDDAIAAGGRADVPLSSAQRRRCHDAGTPLEVSQRHMPLQVGPPLKRRRTAAVRP